MMKSAVAGLVALGVLVSGAASATAQTIKVLIVQEDADDTSLRRDTRIQRNILNAFNQGLNAPSAADIQRKYGIGGMDVYDETSLSVDWYPQGRKRRADPELVSLAREIRNPRLDVLVLYTLHAKAVDRHAMPGVTALHMALSYRASTSAAGAISAVRTLISIATASSQPDVPPASAEGRPAITASTSSLPVRASAWYATRLSRSRHS